MLATDNSQNAVQKRAMCTRCLRAQSACICSCVQMAENVADVLILQHPQESKHIKSSGRLLHLCLTQSRIEIAEQFDEAKLASWLQADQRQTYLLYPDEISRASEVSNQVHQSALINPAKLRLVVIDASWRQSRQILRDNPLLQRLPRYPLSEMPTSRYLIRQAHQADQLSSLEACCYALMQAEQNHDKFQALLQAFDTFNQMQISFGVQRLHRP